MSKENACLKAKYVYCRPIEEARERGEIPLWRESFKANIACKEAIEEAIRQNFDGMHLNEGCLEPVMQEFGFRRVGWVLCHTILEKDWDTRFSLNNREWAQGKGLPRDSDHDYRFVVESHPAVLDVFINMYRKAYMDMSWDEKNAQDKAAFAYEQEWREQNGLTEAPVPEQGQGMGPM